MYLNGKHDKFLTVLALARTLRGSGSEEGVIEAVRALDAGPQWGKTLCGKIRIVRVAGAWWAGGAHHVPRHLWRRPRRAPPGCLAAIRLRGAAGEEGVLLPPLREGGAEGPGGGPQGGPGGGP